MKLRIRYFGILVEFTHCNEEVLLSSGHKVEDLIHQLFDKYPALKGQSFQISQDQIIVNQKTVLTGAEVTLLPPFSGG